MVGAARTTWEASQVRTRDRGETAMWVAIAAPLLMIVALAVIVLVWMWTGPIIAMIVFAALCSAGAAGAAAVQRRNRGG